MACTFPHHRHYNGHLDGLADPCTACQALQWEGVCDLSLNRFQSDPDALADALAFWASAAPATDPERCWIWQGIHKARFRNRWYSPQALAYQLAWGDSGIAPITITCGNPYCVNPFHLSTPQLLNAERRSRSDLVAAQAEHSALS